MPHTNYAKATKWIMGFVVFIFVLVLVFLYPIIQDLSTSQKVSPQSIAFFIITFGGVYSGIFSLLLWTYEAWFWKWHSPRHNYSGYWHMKITYDFCERRPRGATVLKLPYHFESVFKIKQSVFDFSFSEGFSAKNEVWEDQCLRLTGTGFNMAYEVNRMNKKSKDALPSRAIGFETVKIVKRNNREIPVEMMGQMSHNAIPDTALYRGMTYYRRIKKQEYLGLLSEMKSGAYATQYEG